VFVAGDGRISRILPDGTTSTFLGGFSNLNCVEIDSEDNIYVLELLGLVYKVTPSGVLTAVADGFDFCPGGVTAGFSIDTDDNLYVVDPPAGRVFKADLRNSEEVTVFLSGLVGPRDFLLIPTGDGFVSLEGSGDLLKVYPNGEITTFGTGLTPGHLAFSESNQLYVSEWSRNRIVRITCESFSCPTGSISGYIFVDSIALLGVPIDLFDSEGNIVSSAVSDESGWYEFADVVQGQYTISLSPPLGYFTVEETKDVELSCQPLEIDFELSEVSIASAQRSRGYWAHQLYKALEGKPQDYDIAKFSEFGGLIEEHFYNNLINPVEFYHVPQPALQADSMEIMRMLLHMGDRDEQYPFPKRIGRAQLLALMLNVVSGKVHQMHPITADSLTLSQVLTYCDLILNDELEPITDTIPGYSRDSTEWYPYIVAGYILHMANVGLEIPVGLVPPDIDNIAYRLGLGVPSEFILSQNHPNPFNPLTEIEFALPKACHTKLEIFNVLGQRVTTLVDRQLEAGYHRVSWDGTKFASGVYLYRLQAGDYVESKKMMLIK